MLKHELKVQSRTVSGRKSKLLRQKGIIPGNIFGKKIKSHSIQLDQKTFLQVFSEAGESSLIYLHLDADKDPRPVFVRERSVHPVTGELLHIAFNQVDLKEKVTAPVSIILTGEAPAEKEKLGILVQQVDEIEVEALPTDMPENIQIDVSGLAEVGAHISVGDLKLDTTKLEVLTDPTTILVQIEALAKEEVAPVAETPVADEAAPAADGEAQTATPASAPTTPPDKS